MLMENWKKIASLEDFNSIKKNSALIKYPLNGEPADNINMDNKDNHSTYLVDQVKMFNELDLIDLILGKEYDTSLGRITGNVLHKKYKDMISEGIWWYRTKETDKGEQL